MTLRSACLLILLALLPQPLRPADEAETEVVLTLRAADQLAAAVDLDTRTHTGSVRDGQLILDDAELAFGLFQAGKLSFGFRKNELALLVDLGDYRIDPVTTVKDRSPKPPLNVFHTLGLTSGKVAYRAPLGKTFRLREGQAVFGKYPVADIQHVEPSAGDVYLLRTRMTGPSGHEEQLVKLLVLEADAQAVTLRIAPLAEL